MGINTIGLNIMNQDRQFFKEIKENFSVDQIKNLHKVNSLQSTKSILIDWLLIIFAIFLCLKISPYLIPVSLVIIGSRQRALSNLVHDGSHCNLFGNKSINDLIVNLGAASPMFDAVSLYRKSHKDHHSFLGTKNDPDFLKHLEYGYGDENPKKKNSIKLFISLVINFRAWIDSITGSFFELKTNQKIQIALWWITISTILLYFDKNLFIYTMALWWGARMTTYHMIRIFAEFLDHSGLKTGSTFSFTRNIPGAGVLKYILHPHSDNYHLVHHLFPKIPHYNLKKAHSLFYGASKTYINACHCDGYFIGKNSAINSWANKSTIENKATIGVL